MKPGSRKVKSDIDKEIERRDKNSVVTNPSCRSVWNDENKPKLGHEARPRLAELSNIPMPSWHVRGPLGRGVVCRGRGRGHDGGDVSVGDPVSSDGGSGRLRGRDRGDRDGRLDGQETVVGVVSCLVLPVVELGQVSLTCE